jgi:hypothetical protein
MGIIFYLFVGNIKKNIFLFSTLSIIKNRYFMPAREEGSLIRVGEKLFLKVVMTEENKSMLFRSFICNLGQVKIDYIVDERK